MRKVYRALIPYEFRYLFYKFRNPKEFEILRRQVYPSPKGTFSLRAFDCYQCLFIHITKSAGTSVATSLFGELPYHYTAIQYRVIFGRKAFNDYFKFAFVRNPWDRLYSAYCYLKGGGWDDADRAWFQDNLSQLSDFNSFVLDWLKPERLCSHLHLRPQSDFICDRKHKPLLDYLGYFETLPEDFSLVSRRIGIKSQLAHINASERVDYRDIYTVAAIDKVLTLYRRDIESFGYSFDCLKTRMTIRNHSFEIL